MEQITPKGKAKDLYRVFYNQVTDSCFDKHDTSKACALIVAKECCEATYSSKTLVGTYYDCVSDNDTDPERTSEFWKEVITEIRLIQNK